MYTSSHKTRIRFFIRNSARAQFLRGPRQEILVQESLTISDYLRTFSNEIGEQVVSRFPPLHQPGAPASPYLKRLKRQRFRCEVSK